MNVQERGWLHVNSFYVLQSPLAGLIAREKVMDLENVVVGIANALADKGTLNILIWQETLNFLILMLKKDFLSH